MNSHPTVAIDLGTTFTAVSSMDGTTLTNHQFPGNGKQFSSVAFLPSDGGPALIGKKARNAAIKDPSRLFQHFKRRMTSAPNEPLCPDGPSPIEVSARLIEFALKSASQNDPRLGFAIADGSARVAVTHPANYRSEHQKSLLEAARIAGLAKEQVVFASEPSSCVYAYLAGHPIKDGQRILVIDIGGGTCDIAVLAFNAGVCDELIADRGDPTVGGINFDRAVFRELCAQFGIPNLLRTFDSESGFDLTLLGNDTDRRLAMQIRDLAEEIKHALSVEVEHQAFADLSVGLVEAKFTRDQFKRICEEPYRRIEKAVATSLDGSTFSLREIDHVMLAGGSWLLPGLRESIATITNRAPEEVFVHLEPDNVVRQERARFAASGQTTDMILPGGLGIMVERRNNGLVERFGKFLVSPGQPLRSTGATFENAGQFIDARATQTVLSAEFCEAKPGVVLNRSGGDFPLLRESECTVLRTIHESVSGLPPGKHEVQVGIDYTGRILRYRFSVKDQPIEVVHGNILDGSVGSHEPSASQQVVLVIDRSTSMEGQPLDQAKAAAKAFVVTTDSATAIGIVSFGTNCTVHSAPICDRAALVSAIDAIPLDGLTNMDLGIKTAAIQLNGNGLIVLITDGFPNCAQDAAAAARNVSNSVRIVTVGILGADQDFLKYQIATSPADHFAVEKIEELVSTYQRISRLYIQ